MSGWIWGEVQVVVAQGRHFDPEMTDLSPELDCFQEVFPLLSVAC